jgi:hypothetical protein
VPIKENDMNDATQTATAAETKRTKGKPPRKSAKAAAAKTKTPKTAKPKKEKAPRESREGWGTFALKMPVPEREAFHNAAGPAGASRFARTVLVAFANDDEAAFKAALAEARKLRA